MNDNSNPNRCCFMFAWLSLANIIAIAALTLNLASPVDGGAERVQQLQDARQEIMKGGE